jgi:heat shock protein HtpX
MLLLAAISLVLCLSIYILLGPIGVVWTALALIVAMLFAPRVPPDLVMRMYSGVQVSERSGGQLLAIVDELARRAELPRRPRLYVIPSGTLNAFATGAPDNAAIGITEGLLRRLTMREIAGVLAHEMSHIRNNDLRVMGIADIMTRMTQLMSYAALFLATLNVLAALSGEQYAPWSAVLLLYLAPVFASLLQLGLSRAREFDADTEAAGLTGDPLGLASALNRLERYTGHFWEDLMFPVPGRRVPQPSVLRSHPETAERVRRLRDLSGRPMMAPMSVSEEPMISLLGVGPIAMHPRYRFPGFWY